MSVVIRVTADVTDWQSPSQAQLDYGEIRDGVFTLQEFCDVLEVDIKNVDVSLYALSGDDQSRAVATDLAAVVMRNDDKVGKLLLMDQTLDGPFMFMLAQGDKLKGFHCDGCAEQFVKWFIDRQAYGKDTHYASRSPQDKIETKLVH